MKKFLLLSMMLASYSLFAQTKSFTITDSWCGEIDPFLIGDACILTIQESPEMHSHYVIINLDDMFSRYPDVEDFKGMTLVADLQMMEKAEREVRRYLSRWFTITRANKTLYGGEFEILP
jgi:hypothetical protein